MNIDTSNKVVLTLDAGGTNFVFSALKSGNFITEPIQLHPNKNDLSKCLDSIFAGFWETIKLCNCKPDAISFAFPGPADYKNGVIGDLYNLPAFKGGVPLGAILEEKFNIPVFINNDGNLFAYGEAIAGLLPTINKKLKDHGSNKVYNNLIGITLGTGLGAGISINGELLHGDNFAAGEVWSSTNKKYPHTIVEESISIRGIQRVYCNILDIDLCDSPDPKEIYLIATGQMPGNAQAAKEAYREFSEILGETLLNLISLTDGLVVIGGGLSGATGLFMQNTIDYINTTVRSFNGSEIRRLESKVYNLNDENEFFEFAKEDSVKIQVPNTNKFVNYEAHKKTGVGLSVLGTNHAIMAGAYSYAINMLDKSVPSNKKFVTQNIKENT